MNFEASYLGPHCLPIPFYETLDINGNILNFLLLLLLLWSLKCFVAHAVEES